MINLTKNCIFATKIMNMEPVICNDFKDTRSGFGVGLLKAGKINADVMALCADVAGSLKMTDFQKEFPDRFIQVGIAEANMIGISAGLALSGKIPVAGAFAGFVSGRVYDQVRVSVAYSNLNVKIAAAHAGISVGEDGATHQMLEDLGMMKMLPNMVVINTCDFNQTKMATLAAIEYQGPVYLRFGRPSVPNFTPENQPFIIGKANKLQEGTDVSIFATGHLVYPALEAAYILFQKGISAEVINIHTIKPLDNEAVLKSVMKTKCVVTAEEHMRNGGLGDSISQLLALNYPAPVEMVAINDKFGESGTSSDLMIKYGLDSTHMVSAAEKVIGRLNS
jgi:transketolase